MKRRAFLATGGTLVPLAGCTSLVPWANDATCSSRERFSMADEVETDRLGAFTLSVTPAEVQHGDTITVRMENAEDDERLSGNRRKFMIHRLNDGEWQSVFTDGGRAGWNDMGFEHPPGEGFTWNLTVSRSGFSEAPNNLQPCADVRPGEYRFVYWGVGTEKEYGLAAEFTVTE